MDSNNILSIIAIVISIVGTICSVINHKKIRSRCCFMKDEIVASIDIENTSPDKETPLKIKIPDSPKTVLKFMQEENKFSTRV